MDPVIALARVIPFAFAAGINLYATVIVLGLAARYDLIALPEQFSAFENPVIISIAVVMYIVEFVADKIPWVDSIWDAVHTLVPAARWRPGRRHSAGRSVGHDGTAHGAGRRVGGDDDPPREGRHTGGCEHESGAVQ